MNFRDSDSAMKHLSTFILFHFHSDIFLEKNNKIVARNNTISHARTPFPFFSELY